MPCREEAHVKGLGNIIQDGHVLDLAEPGIVPEEALKKPRFNYSLQRSHHCKSASVSPGSKGTHTYRALATTSG
jgi:hypothetical protein